MPEVSLRVRTPDVWTKGASFFTRFLFCLSSFFRNAVHAGCSEEIEEDGIERS